MSKPTIHVAVLTTAERQGWVNPALAQFLADMRLDDRFAVDPFDFREGHNRVSPELARNHIARSYLAHSQAEHLLMIDNDIAPEYVQRPVNLLELALVVAEHGPAIVGAPCPIYRRPHLQLNIFHQEPTGWRPFHQKELEQCPENGLFPVDAVGTGVILIPRCILLHVGDPPFEQPRKQDGGLIGDSEDVRFCTAARAKGYPVIASMNHLCDHLRTAHLLDLGIRQYITDESPTEEEALLTLSKRPFDPVRSLWPDGEAPSVDPSSPL
jgi:hypothetical protein